MSDDNRIVKLESDVHHLQSDVTEIKEDVKFLRAMIEALRSEFLTFKAEVSREFGSIRTSIERERSCGWWLRGSGRFCRCGERHWHWPDFFDPESPKSGLSSCSVWPARHPFAAR